VETLEKQLDNPQVLQAKLDDPRKQVDLGVVAGWVLGAPNFSAARAVLPCHPERSEGSQRNEWSRLKRTLRFFGPQRTRPSE